ncbi:MAG: alpha/beta fold hydrolase [Pseudomonadota bacterium]
MPAVMSQGHRINYTLAGTGPLVVLQHGFLDSSASWNDLGYAAAISNRYTVACVDSLGHGDSDKPLEAERYQQQARAADLVAVIDDLGFEQAHLVGYSMGGWMSAGVAKYFPERLASLAIGGWDYVDGIKTAFAGMGVERIEFEMFIGFARESAPALTEWVTNEVLGALAPCFSALYEIDGNADAVNALDVPVMLWNGEADAYHGPMRYAAIDQGFSYFSAPGDHLSSYMEQAPDFSRALLTFFDRAQARGAR